MVKFFFISLLTIVFFSCNNTKKENNSVTESQANSDSTFYAEQGLNYALATKAVLGKNLMGTIQKKGVLEALSFCNERAYPLTDSMALAQNAKIKRVSDRPRNPNNMASPSEINHINTFKKQLESGKAIAPIVEATNNRTTVYYPITINALCLQCHGTPQDIAPETIKMLGLLYPNDKAIGYGVNQVRGIWNVSFERP
ncbi:MAG: DUF3365 domain-containing protein [Flavobacteriaceae bacterium]